MYFYKKIIKKTDEPNENDITTPYEKTVNGDTMTIEQLTKHLDGIADNDGTMFCDEFKQKLKNENF